MATKKTLVSLIACSLALVQLVALCQAEQKQQLCSGEKVKLLSLSDLEHTTAVGCDQSVVENFDDLVELVLGDKNICTMKKATGITRYFETYANERRYLASPKELIRFVVAYGMQVNSQCKEYMTDAFYEKVGQAVSEGDYEQIKQWTSDEGPIARILSPIIKQGEFLLPSHLERILPKPERESMLKLDSVDEDKMTRVKDLCKNRFRKLYEPILLPIAHLDSHGLNYKSDRLSRHLALSTKTREHNNLWSRIVFLCETVKEMGELNDAEMGPSQVEEIEELAAHLEIKDEVVDDSDLSLKLAMESFPIDGSAIGRLKERIYETLKSSGRSFESMDWLVERAFEEGDQQDENLMATKRQLVSLLDPANRKEIAKVISKMANGGKKAGRKIANALETSKLVASTALFSPGVLLKDPHALSTLKRTQFRRE